MSCRNLQCDMGSCYDGHHKGETLLLGRGKPQRTRISSSMILLCYQSKQGVTSVVSRAAGAAVGLVLAGTAQCGPPASGVTHWEQQREGKKGEKSTSAEARLH